jgi:hypothetical protein
MLRNLDESWKVQIFHGIGNEADLKDKFSKEIQEGRLYLTRMMVQNLTLAMYNHLMLNRSFWEHVIGEKVLLFEVDSALCDHSAHHIDEFLKFDYIGAPWIPKITHGCRIYQSKEIQTLKYVVDEEDVLSLREFEKRGLKEIFISAGPQIGNSGLSLRSRKKMFQILSEYMPKSPHYWDRSNDMYLACIVAYPENDLKVPSIAEAMRFSTESIFYKGSLGFHKSWDYFFDEKEDVLQSFCPDYSKIKKLYQTDRSEKDKNNMPI